MEESLLSSSWYRVAHIRPRPRSHVQIHHHTYRGKDWYILQDYSTGRFHRFTPEVYFIIGLMDGRRTMNEIWNMACAKLGDDMPTQDELINLLSQLYRADALQSDIQADIDEIHNRNMRLRRNRIISYILSPMAVRFPLLDPDRFLERTLFLVRPLLSWAGAFLWCVVVLSALFLAGIHWKELTSNFADRILSMENLFLIALIYPCIKVIHEFGHAYMVKRWGGEVHEMGFILLVFLPVPYVDASSSSAFNDKHKRILVGAIGILLEVFIAALAICVWVVVEPGAVRAVAYNIVFIAGVSTILFNGNPLLRYDAYYILSDYLDIPNLGTRANRYIGYLVQRYIFGIRDAISTAFVSGERGWFIFYAIASFLYRIFITVQIILFVAGRFFVIGVLLAAWAVISMLIAPMVKIIHNVFTDIRAQTKRIRIALTCAALAGLSVFFILAIPVPFFTMAEGVVWMPEQSQVYAGADGFIKMVAVSNEQEVRQGDILIVCENPDLIAKLEVLEAQLKELQVRYRDSIFRDRTEAEILKDEIERVQAELERTREQVMQLEIRSQVDGVFLIPQAQNLPGRFIRRGMPLGYVINFSQVLARVVVPQSDVDYIRANTRKIGVRLAENIDKIVPAKVVREMPAATKDLPSLALSVEGGGSFALDTRKVNQQQAFENLFQFELVLLGVKVGTVGERVYVRFEHEPESLIYRWYRSMRRLLLSRFDM